MSSYRSKKGTVINIPDNLTPKQIASIKADADAGYGTRAQQTANDLGKQAAPTTGGGLQDPAAAFSTDGKSPEELQAMLKHTQAEIDKRGGFAKAPNYATRLQQIQGAINESNKAPQANGPVPGTVPDASGYQPGPEPKPAYPDYPFTNKGGALTNKSVNPDGTLNTAVASDNVATAENNDVNSNFQMEHPQLVTDENGNSREITRHKDGTVTVKDTAGGLTQTFKDLATAAAQTFNGSVSRKNAEDATYGTLTKYYDRDMSREQEAKKQDLANRGIPYNPAAAEDPNTNDLYGKTLGAIDQKYRGLKDNASQQAILSGNQAYATDANARDSFLSAVTSGASTFGGHFGNYTNNTSTDQSANDLAILNMSAQEYANKYGLSLQEAQSKRNDATARLAIAQSAKNKASSGGGSTKSSSSDTGGFEVLS